MFFSHDALNPTGNGLDADHWWKGAVVYQIYPRSFKDSNGDGYGDLEGIRSKLDYLKGLGVDVLWLSPIYASPQADNGYDISDYYGIDPMFGTLEDFDRLLTDVHAHGMRLVMDLVVNHSSDENPWFIESRSSRQNPKRDWYFWRDPRPGFAGGQQGGEPNNWESFFSGSAWQWDEATGQYYLHLFHKKQPDLNWDNPEVRAAVYEMMNWWLDRGVDGFRMDVINLISKNPGLPDGEKYPGRAWGEGFPLFSEGPHLHEYLAEMRREVFDGRDAPMTVGETPGVRRDNVLLFTDPARHELDMVFQFAHVDLGLENGKFRPRALRPGELADCLTDWQNAQDQVGWNSLYLDNHDQPRAVSRFGDEAHRYASATALATALHMLRGTPYVYQGEELGMTNGTFEGIDDFRDVEALRYYREATQAGESPESVLNGMRLMGRDNARTPVQWDDGPHAGFTTGTPWIDVTSNYTEINAASQVGDPNSVYAYYRALTQIRHGLPVIASGDFERIATPTPAVFAYRRTMGDAVATILVNLSDAPAPLGEAAARVPGTLLLSNRDLPEENRNVPAVLGEWEARVYIA